MKYTEIGKHLVIDPAVCHGQLTFQGTRVPVDTVLALLAKGYSTDQLLKSYPELSRTAIEEALKLATDALQTRYRQPLEVAAWVKSSWTTNSSIRKFSYRLRVGLRFNVCASCGRMKSLKTIAFQDCCVN